MCENVPITEGESITKPEYRLADMMTRDLTVRIDPNLLRLFLQLHWTKITKLAHERMKFTINFNPKN
jgi:hypothetical protein